jgi:excinuclease ABC subunit B
MDPEERAQEIKALKKEMERAAKDLDFIEAARIRDLIKALEKSN